jgi:voltage-gated potassium channel
MDRSMTASASRPVLRRPAPPRDRIGRLLNELYHGHTRRALRFQATWLVFDVIIIAFFMIAPFIEHGLTFYVIDYAIAAVLAADLAARAWAYGDLRRWFLRPIVWADIAVLASLLVPAYAANLGFLRALRAFSLIHGHAFWRTFGRRLKPWEEPIKAISNLVIFIFMMTGLVHALFAGRTENIRSYIDSLYFTVTSLTTTGYGDITLPGFWGRFISIVMMIGGVTLFFRLASVIVRPHKVAFRCPACGLGRHDRDAVHCKACGTLINIPDEDD